MSKQDHRLRRRDPAPDEALDQILNSPRLAHVVPQLQPDVLHRLIQHRGLEESGEIVALATPEQLARVFDIDLWRAARPGLDERFDAGRFGAWLEMMAESVPAVAVKALTAMDIRLAAMGLAHHVRVFDYSAVASFVTTDGDEMNPGHWMDESFRCDVGGYVVVARRTEAWDAIADVLVALEGEDRRYFTQVMNECRAVSSSRPEIDGLDDLLTVRDQAMFDVAVDREERRDAEGYVTPAEARAFLQSARTANHQRAAAPAERVVIVEPASHALLKSAGPVPQLTQMQTQMQRLHDRHPDLFAARSAELAFLANALIAGTSVQSRWLNADEASNAAVAVCNLGLENWSDPEDDVLAHHELTKVFEVGWQVLYREVCLDSAERLIDTLASVQSHDPDTQASLDALRKRMTRHWRAGTPWAARGALEVISILDAPAWAALMGLVDEFPVLHDAVAASLSGATRAVDPTGFEFISENRQIALVRDFMRTLPGTLSG